MRLDLYLLENKLVNTRSQATDFIKRGFVKVDGRVITKAGYEITNQTIELIEHQSFVGRAGEKLYYAILDFNLDFTHKVVVDIGASTGGFTECSLQSGANLVYTYDVGKDQLATKLRDDRRVIVHEETNILDVDLPYADIILIDVSFTSIKPILKHISNFEKEIVALIKPQYEAGAIFFKQGVLKDQKMHKKILIDVLNYAKDLGFHVVNLKKSQIKGKKGNQEYMIYIDGNKNANDIDKLIGEVI